MTPAATGPADPLAPVRAALLRAAEEDAGRLVAAARHDAGATLAKARAAAAATLREARRHGAEDGARAAAAGVAEARRTARARLLEAQADAYQELRRQVLVRVRRYRREACAPEVRERLARQVYRALGPGAAVAAHPAGGVTGTAPGRRVDLTPEALAARVLDRAGPGVEELWRS
ncbi:hypothetical protein MUU72_03555 [Streptomyces sp. RS10V-4]|uniref:hypothetical protein n=1 Tax=Streptomyces rhizoryzae TaxID=2932493 RepID=UPI002005B149|nr:hypothetical protein [Streptomyces rhizoryzae]MCK7622210.1 hypothetical protein [Streptomyces rhizoryzae]